MKPHTSEVHVQRPEWLQVALDTDDLPTDDKSWWIRWLIKVKQDAILEMLATLNNFIYNWGHGPGEVKRRGIIRMVIVATVLSFVLWIFHGFQITHFSPIEEMVAMVLFGIYGCRPFNKEMAPYVLAARTEDEPKQLE